MHAKLPILVFLSVPALMFAQVATQGPALQPPTVIDQPVFSSMSDLPPVWNGLKLKTSEKVKKLSIELPDGTFAEVHVPVLYYAPDAAALIKWDDTQSIAAVTRDLERVLALPPVEQMQLHNQQILQNCLIRLKNYHAQLLRRVPATEVPPNVTAVNVLENTK